MRIAQTVVEVARGTDPVVSIILDRKAIIDQEFVDRALSLPQFSWHGRRPCVGHTKDGSVGHDLDLLSVMVELARRNALVKLPGYGNMLPWQITAGEQHVGTDRFGQIVRLVSHREHLSFSVRIKDESVIKHAAGTAQAGALRTYMMVDYNGNWHAGWRGVEWKYSEAEAEFFGKRRLLQNGQLSFRDYVHRNRRQSIFGRPYLILKLLWQRIEDEIAFYGSELKRLQKAGVGAPKGLEAQPKSILAQGKTRNIFVRRFILTLHGPQFRGEFTPVATTTDGYRVAYHRRQELLKKLQPIVQFVVRADEAAFYRYGMDRGFVANWIRGPQWVEDLESRRVTIHITEGLSLTYYTDEVPKAVAA